MTRVRQHPVDSWLESITSTFVGFLFAMATWLLIIDPIWGLQTSVADSFWITCVFTVSSIIRQFLIRRLFDGRGVYQGIKAIIKERRNGQRVRPGDARGTGHHREHFSAWRRPGHSGD